MRRYNAEMGATSGQNEDLAWLLQRNAHRLRGAADELALKRGLEGGFRDYALLLILDVEKPSTQIELGTRAGVDKTTLMSVLDRLEEGGLVERKLNPDNRRVRRPVLTTKGRKVLAAVTVVRRASEDVPGMSMSELKTLRTLLVKLDTACDAAGMKSPGSCM